MLDFVWRILGFSLEKDIVRAHQLARAKKYFEAEEVRKAKELIDEAENATAPPPNSARTFLFNAPTTDAKKAHGEAVIART
tara:strand:+ start:1978 stop:2220 length:243 start_codon:yes stop_codon:yes gene_type:complete